MRSPPLPREVCAHLKARGYDGGLSIEPHLAAVVHDTAVQPEASVRFDSADSGRTGVEAVMINESRGLELLSKYGLSERRVRHSLGVADFAERLARAIHALHPDLPVDPAKVRLAALLHDVGRGLPGDHEINSAAVLRQEGLPELADIVMHGSAYELALLRGTDDPRLLPQGLENKIVAYADCRFRLAPVTLQERINEVLLRRSAEEDKVASVKMAAARYFLLEKELLALAGNEFTAGTGSAPQTP